jgi:hypothetical protein
VPHLQEILPLTVFTVSFILKFPLRKAMNFPVVKPTRCTSFSNYLFLYNTLHVLDGLSVHHQKFRTVLAAAGMSDRYGQLRASRNEMEMQSQIMYSYCLYVLFCIFCFHRANWYSSATLTEVFPCFFPVVRQIPGYNSQRRGTANTLPK